MEHHCNRDLFSGDDFLSKDGIVNLFAPVTARQLKRIDEKTKGVQWECPLSDAEHQRIGAHLTHFPSVHVRRYSNFEPLADLTFLRFFPATTAVQIDVYHLRSLDGIEFLSPRLRQLALDETESKRFSLSFLSRFRRLQNLSLHSLSKDLEVIGELTQLKYLNLRSIPLSNLDVLRPLHKLETLSLQLGGTRNLEALASLPELKVLNLWRINGLDDLTAVSKLEALQYLHLEDLSLVKKLPSLRAMSNLRRLDISNLKRLGTLDGVQHAPSLEHLEVFQAPLSPEAFAILKNHRTLRTVNITLKTDKHTEAAVAAVGRVQAIKRPFVPKRLARRRN
jgi:hypothetical protein